MEDMKENVLKIIYKVDTFSNCHYPYKSGIKWRVIEENLLLISNLFFYFYLTLSMIHTEPKHTSATKMDGNKLIC